MKVDSKGWKALARTVRPLIERILEEQVREAGYFISLMSRLVITYPNWACQVVGSQASIDAATRQRFNALVAQTRKPGASKGRPVVAQNQPGGRGPAPAVMSETRRRHRLERDRSTRRSHSDLGILVRMGFFGRGIGVNAVRIIAIRSRCLMDLLKIPSIVPQMIATIGIQANQGRALRIVTTLVMVSPFIRRRDLDQLEMTARPQATILSLPGIANRLDASPSPRDLTIHYDQFARCETNLEVRGSRFSRFVVRTGGVAFQPSSVAAT